MTPVFYLFIMISVIIATICVRVVWKQRSKKVIIMGITIGLLIELIMLLSFASLVKNSDWEVQQVLYLDKVLYDSYLIEEQAEGQEIYSYKLENDEEEDKVRTVYNTNNIQVRKESIEEGEKPCLIKYIKTGWVTYKFKYVFYVPQS